MVNVILALWLGLNCAAAQDYDVVQQAFTNSYTFETNGEYTKAVDALKEVYQEDSYPINLRLGWLTYLSGLFTDSKAYYQKAIALQPMSLEAKLGFVYPAYALGNWEVVKKQYDDILAIDPNNTLALFRLGSIYYGRENYGEALALFEKVANLYPFDYDSNLMFAWTCLKLGKFREAKVLFQTALLIKPDDKSAREGLEMIE